MWGSCPGGKVPWRASATNQFSVLFSTKWISSSTWRGSQCLKCANGELANLPPPSPPMPVSGESLTKGLEWPARPCTCASIYTSFLVTGRSNCQRALDRCGAGKQGEVFTIKYSARIYGKPAQNPSQSPTQVLESLALLCWTLCSCGSWHRFCRRKQWVKWPCSWGHAHVGLVLQAMRAPQPLNIANPHFYPCKTRFMRQVVCPSTSRPFWVAAGSSHQWCPPPQRWAVGAFIRIMLLGRVGLRSFGGLGRGPRLGGKGWASATLKLCPV